MSSFDDLTKAITCRFNDTIKKSCSSLFSYLNLNNFWYYKITISGYFTFFGTHIAACEYFAAEKFYRDFYYYHHPKFFQSGISLQQSVSSSPFIKKSTDQFNLNHSLLIMSKVKDGIEGFGVSSESKSELQLVQMLNEVQLIRLFTTHFRKENKLIFSKLEDNKIDLKTLMGPAFSTPPIRVEPKAAEKRSLLKTLGMDFINDLSVNEIEIIKRLIDGYSANQIADQMYRSKRTVEHAVERIKDKMGCEKKPDLIKKARELESLGLLDSSSLMTIS